MQVIHLAMWLKKTVGIMDESKLLWMLESERKTENAGKSQQVRQHLWRENRANVLNLTKGHPDLKRWLSFLSTDAVRLAEIFQHFCFCFRFQHSQWFAFIHLIKTSVIMDKVDGSSAGPMSCQNLAVNSLPPTQLEFPGLSFFHFTILHLFNFPPSVDSVWKELLGQNA